MTPCIMLNNNYFSRRDSQKYGPLMFNLHGTQLTLFQILQRDAPADFIDNLWDVVRMS
jgi:hypothetical protein